MEWWKGLNEKIRIIIFGFFISIFIILSVFFIFYKEIILYIAFHKPPLSQFSGCKIKNMHKYLSPFYKIKNPLNLFLKSYNEISFESLDDKHSSEGISYSYKVKVYFRGGNVEKYIIGGIYNREVDKIIKAAESHLFIKNFIDLYKVKKAYISDGIIYFKKGKFFMNAQYLPYKDSIIIKKGKFEYRLLKEIKNIYLLINEKLNKMGIILPLESQVDLNYKHPLSVYSIKGKPEGIEDSIEVIYKGKEELLIRWYPVRPVKIESFCKYVEKRLKKMLGRKYFEKYLRLEKAYGLYFPKYEFVKNNLLNKGENYCIFVYKWKTGFKWIDEWNEGAKIWIYLYAAPSGIFLNFSPLRVDTKKKLRPLQKLISEKEFNNFLNYFKEPKKAKIKITPDSRYGYIVLTDGNVFVDLEKGVVKKREAGEWEECIVPESYSYFEEVLRRMKE